MSSSTAKVKMSLIPMFGLKSNLLLLLTVSNNSMVSCSRHDFLIDMSEFVLYSIFHMFSTLNVE